MIPNFTWTTISPILLLLKSPTTYIENVENHHHKVIQECKVRV